MADELGCEVVVVHAVDFEAAAYYASFGFTPFIDHPLHLLMTIKDVRATLAELS